MENEKRIEKDENNDVLTETTLAITGIPLHGSTGKDKWLMITLKHPV